MTQRLDRLQAALETVLGDKIKAFKRERGEISIIVSAVDYLAVVAACATTRCSSSSS